MKYGLLLTLGLCLAQPALAASDLPTTVMMGTVATASVTGVNLHHCSTNPGPAMFQRGAVSVGNPHPPAILDLPSVGVSQRLIGFSFTGAILLRFTSATGGNVGFDYNQSTINTTLPTGVTARFGNYSQVWTPSAGTLKVSFDILFQNCTLPIVALFRTVQ